VCLANLDLLFPVALLLTLAALHLVPFAPESLIASLQQLGHRVPRLVESMLVDQYLSQCVGPGVTALACEILGLVDDHAWSFLHPIVWDRSAQGTWGSGECVGDLARGDHLVWCDDGSHNVYPRLDGAFGMFVISESR